MSYFDSSCYDEYEVYYGERKKPLNGVAADSGL
jgi:hypothetical protein